MEEEYHITEEERIRRELEAEEKQKKHKKARKWIRIAAVVILLAVVAFFVYDSHQPREQRKPVIYLYPETATEVTVQLDYDGELTTTYPAYSGAWKVTAEPDGTLTDADGKVYNYLFWEGVSRRRFDMSEGFCVKGSDTAAFLEDALAKLGLTRREANEFIVYWLPLMENNVYNVISFQTEAYTDGAKLMVDPEPDTVIRVFMAWYGCKRFKEIPAQELTAPERKGFTVVEWGGSEVR